jgi:hypothetical protein
MVPIDNGKAFTSPDAHCRVTRYLRRQWGKLEN